MAFLSFREGDDGIVDFESFQRSLGSRYAVDPGRSQTPSAASRAHREPAAPSALSEDGLVETPVAAAVLRASEMRLIGGQSELAHLSGPNPVRSARHFARSCRS